MKLKLRFILLSRRKSANQPCTISLRLGYDRKYIFQDTGIEVLQSQFNEKEAAKGFWAVVKKHPKKDQYNLQLKAIQDKVFNIYHELMLSNMGFSLQSIKTQLLKGDHRAVRVFSKILEEDRSIKPNTKASINTMIIRLQAFAPDIMVGDIDYTFAKNFEKWLLSVPTRTEGTLSVNTTNKYLRDLVRMLERCIKYDYVNKNKLKGYDFIKEPRGSYTKREHLTFEEVEYLENFDFSDYISGRKLESINYTRDAFLFACWTGLRIGDLLSVCKNDLKDGVLTVESEKGGVTILLPIQSLFSGKAFHLLEKHGRYKLGSLPLFGDKSRITHQANIGFIRSLVFPKKKISFHSARHTFGTLLIEMSVNPLTVQRLLGHKKLDTTLNVYDHHSWEKEFSEIKNKFGS